MMKKALLIILFFMHTTANATYVTGSNQGTCETKTLVNHDKNFNPIGSVITRVCWMKNAPIIYQEVMNQGNIDTIMRAKAAYVTIDPPKNDKGEYIPFRGYFKASSDGTGKSLVYTSEIFQSNNYGKPEQQNNKVYKFSFLPGRDKTGFIQSKTFLVTEVWDREAYPDQVITNNIYLGRKDDNKLTIEFNQGVFENDYCLIKIDDSRGKLIFNDSSIDETENFARFNVGTRINSGVAHLSFSHVFNDKATEKRFDDYFDEYYIRNYGNQSQFRFRKNDRLNITGSVNYNRIEIAPIINLNKQDLSPGKYRMVTTITCKVSQ